jgi:hypothetical protein
VRDLLSSLLVLQYYIYYSLDDWFSLASETVAFGKMRWSDCQFIHRGIIDSARVSRGL